MAATSKIVSSGGIPAPKTKLASWIQPALAARISPEAVKVEPNILLNLLDKTTTQLARGAVNQLKGVSQAVLSEAVNTVKNKKIKPELLMNYLERKVRIGEVLNDMAKDWDRETKEDFTQALNMEPKKVDVMDSIVSLAILNDPELENDLRVENMDEGDGAKLLEKPADHMAVSATGNTAGSSLCRAGGGRTSWTSPMRRRLLMIFSDS